MARRAKPLTNTQVKQAKSKQKEYSLYDGNGLSLKIRPSGSKSWIFQYKTPVTKKRQNISLGSYPDVSLQKARDLATEYRKILASGIDPKLYRDQQAQQSKAEHLNTFSTVAQKWFDVKKTKISERHAEKLFRSLQLHVFPVIGDTPITQLRAPDVVEKLQSIAASGKLETLHRVINRINQVMEFAVNGGLIASNPLAKIGQMFETPKKMHFPTLKPDELPSLMLALANANITRQTRFLIEWQLHTMVRPSEAAGARWQEIDMKNSRWLIPAARMKSNRSHIVPLSRYAKSLLDMMRPISEHREFIFSGVRDPSKHVNVETANTALKRMGFKNVLVAHGLRALASTTLNEHGFAPDVIEAALAHVDPNDVRRAYNRAEYLEQRFKMMEWWSDYICKAAEGNLSLANVRQMNLVHMVCN